MKPSNLVLLCFASYFAEEAKQLDIKDAIKIIIEYDIKKEFIPPIFDPHKGWFTYYGLTAYPQKQIYINSILDDTVAYKTLLHEMLHIKYRDQSEEEISELAEKEFSRIFSK